MEEEILLSGPITIFAKKFFLSKPIKFSNSAEN
jgi:hypothetical protein